MIGFGSNLSRISTPSSNLSIVDLSVSALLGFYTYT